MNSIFDRFTLAIAVVLTGLKASLLEVCIFLHFNPCKITQLLSSDDSCMQIATSAKSVSAINFAAHIKLNDASLLPLSELLCAPTRITGIGREFRIKLNAADV